PVIRESTNSWTKCGCDPPWPAPCVKERCWCSSESYTPFVVKCWISFGNNLAKSGLTTSSGISGSGLLAVCTTKGFPSINGHSTDFFDPYTSKLSLYCLATSKRERYTCAPRSELRNLIWVVSTANGEL